MKNFNFVLIPMVLATMGLAACGGPATPPVRICTDKTTNMRVDDSKCAAQPFAAGGQNNGGINPILPYYWYYMHGGYGGYGVPAIGAAINPQAGGSYTSKPGMSYGSAISSGVAVSRGGFGSSASSGAGE